VRPAVPADAIWGQRLKHMAAGAIRLYGPDTGAKEVGMFLYVRKSFMIFKIVLACIAFLAAIIALLGTSQNSLLLTQETGKQLGVVMALVFGIITIVEAFMAPPEAIISDKIFSGWKTGPDAHSPMVGMQKSGEAA
jgi:hypothetical protein